VPVPVPVPVSAATVHAWHPECVTHSVRCTGIGCRTPDADDAACDEWLNELLAAGRYVEDVHAGG